MTKISITGPKKHLEEVVDELHNLELMDISQYEGDLETGNPREEAEELSELLVDIRSVASKLPEIEIKEEKISIQQMQEKLPRIKKKVENLDNEKEEIEKQLDKTKKQRTFFKRLRGSGLTNEDLQGSRTLKVFVGDIKIPEFKREVQSDKFDIFQGKSADVVVYKKQVSDEVEQTLQNTSTKKYKVPDTELQGTAEEIFKKTEEKKHELQKQKQNIFSKKKKIAKKRLGNLKYLESFISEKIEKAEAPIRFSTTERSFTAWGWIPDSKYEIVEERLAEKSDGKIYLQKEETEEDEQPPVKYQNNRFVKPFESLTDLVATPKYNELDPSAILLLTFPLFFGFMIGDAGYGITTLAVFYAGYRMFPGAKEIFKSLMYASVATIIFGLAFGDAFGFVIFGNHSELAAVTGIQLFEQIPILFHRAEHLGQVFTISALIGLAHVNLGYAIGFYNEYINHGLKEAFLEKGSWYCLQIGALIAYLFGITAGAPVLALSVILLYLGEGIEGIVEIPSLLANILSYLRIFGVSVAAVALAAVVNSIANTAYASGTLTGLALGTTILLIGHIFNTFIKIMEGFLQGIRLHYVEMFGKFFEGGGKKYAPFGANQS